MTKKEALQSLITFEVGSNLIDKFLLDSEIVGTVTYTKDHKQEIDLCLAEFLDFIITTPDESEGDWSRKIDKVQLSILKNNILKKYGLNEGTINCETIW
jgi:hypothetical protein